MKIIHLLCHSIALREDYIFDGWPGRLAKNIQKYSLDKYEQECWFAVNNIKKMEVWEREGIKYCLFPAWTLNKLLESFCGIIISPTLTKALKNEANSRGIVFHIQGERSYLLWQMISIIKKCPIFLQFHGYYSPWHLFFVERFIITPIERYYFKFVDYFLIHAKAQYRYLVDNCRVPADKISSNGIGVDYDIFKPLDKNQARRELGLPADKNIILYVGIFNEVKGVQKIIKIHKKIKDQYNTFLMVIGGSKSDRYYKYCQENADLVRERIPHELLAKYFSAADVDVAICNNRKVKFGGLGIAPMEALACNTPILNSNLAEAPEEIKNKIGFIVDSENNLKQKIIYVINHKDKYKNLHEITKPYFSWEVIIPNILNLYRKICKI